MFLLRMFSFCKISPADIGVILIGPRFGVHTQLQGWVSFRNEPYREKTCIVFLSFFMYCQTLAREYFWQAYFVDYSLWVFRVANQVTHKQVRSMLEVSKRFEKFWYIGLGVVLECIDS